MPGDDAFPATSIRTQTGSVPARRVGTLLAGMLRPATGFPLPVRCICI